MAGVLFGERGKSSEAQRELERAVSFDSTFALAWFDLGQSVYRSVRSRDLVIAQSHLERAWEFRDRLSVKDRMRLEAYRYNLDIEFDKAIEVYEAMLVRWPDDRQVLGGLQALYYMFWNFRMAAPWGREGWRLYPEDAMITAMYMNSLAATGHAEAATRIGLESLVRNPEDATRWDDLGSVYLYAGQPASAEIAYRRATDLDPGWDRHWTVECAFARGELSRAISLAEVEVEAGEFTALRNLIPFMVAAGRRQEAIDRLVQTTDPQSPAGQWGLRHGWMYLLLGQPEKTLEIADLFASQGGTPRWELYYLRLRARALAALGRFDEASEAAAELKSGSWGALARFVALKVEAEVELGRGNPDRALILLQRMREQGAGYGNRWDMELRDARARAFTMQGELDTAAAEYEELLRIYGGYAPARHELAKVYEKLGRDQEAVAELERFLGLWADADEGLPRLLDARSRLEALKQTG
jgi:tetratricopeptide (TPR) repeat protein